MKAVDRNLDEAREALPSISAAVLADRYLAPGETTRRDVFKRAARALSGTEAPDRRGRIARLFYANMLRGAIGAGRIMANAGRPRDVTMVNCFVHPIGSGASGAVATVADVDRALADARTTLLMGGGVGYDFSPVAPRDANADGAGQDNNAGGVCASIDRFDAACATLPFADTRGGAQMAVLRCDHPDLLDFVMAKRGRRRWSTFNVSVAITNAFMQAVAGDAPWMLRHGARPGAQRLADGAHRLVDGDWCYATLPARRLWQTLVQCARDSAEPGLLFIDTINADNALASIETIAATNPCGEQPLPPWGSCVLGPIDLSRLVHCPFGVGGAPRFDYAGLAERARVQVRMLDNAIDLTRWPLPEHMHEARTKRRIGVGVTGLADALAMMCLPYGTPAARHLATRIAQCLRDQAYAASSALAAERGAYPAFDAARILRAGSFASRLPGAVRDAIALHGLRNSHLLSFAPTGSVSLAFADNCSSGIEPAYDWVYLRRLRVGHGAPRAYRIENRAYRLFRSLHGDRAPQPAYFVKAVDVDPAEHIAMVAALQPFVDASISKTVIVPPDITADRVDALFFQAWRTGLKGITIFRPDPSLDDVLCAEPAAQTRSACYC
ncbi:adenosylcobalamin-dependent ribonucleoside-diphosphate reductase [Ralstonia solanacearum]|uniref:adenosylcobalamin-dependent ribonucleoside-diphosphate reductase n=1 Tax=Ralstonia solanacearum TaxID=305 RepID=UPI001FF87C22|nr:adenosylcobalamin-dependent ribonucleoside-diphosphate reductase [Ralstonia solanacearum]MDB0528761.1 adenosylcobalamin-dependent ribonucleoside-diphosphate reductase [Ralstonia solanacearum]